MMIIKANCGTNRRGIISNYHYREMLAYWLLSIPNVNLILTSSFEHVWNVFMLRHFGLVFPRIIMLRLKLGRDSVF